VFTLSRSLSRRPATPARQLSPDSSLAGRHGGSARRVGTAPPPGMPNSRRVCAALQPGTAPRPGMPNSRRVCAGLRPGTAGPARRLSRALQPSTGKSARRVGPAQANQPAASARHSSSAQANQPTGSAQHSSQHGKPARRVGPALQPSAGEPTRQVSPALQPSTGKPARRVGPALQPSTAEPGRRISPTLQPSAAELACRVGPEVRPRREGASLTGRPSNPGPGEREPASRAGKARHRSGAAYADPIRQASPRGMCGSAAGRTAGQRLCVLPTCAAIRPPLARIVGKSLAGQAAAATLLTSSRPASRASAAGTSR
jgi:hypothetical protein